MDKFNPIHLIVIIAIVVIGLGLIFRGVGSPSAAVVVEKNKVQTLPAKQIDTPSIVKRADDLPPPIARTQNELVTIELTTQELTAEMMPGVTYKYWTYNGTVPGPFLRVLEGDTVRITLNHGEGGDHMHSGFQVEEFANMEEAESFLGIHKAQASEGHTHGQMEGANATDPHMMGDSHAMEGHSTHSIDLHSVIGPGGGAMLTQVGHDGPKTFEFKALRPGIYIYHCASPHIPTHVANGMYGMILVEPQSGLASVDKEFYVMQGEFYTKGEFGQLGHQEFDKEKLLSESPTYFVFNGRVGGITGDRAMRAKVGDRIRMFVGVGSHVASNFHIIGGIFDKLYKDGAIVSEPLRNVQTTIVPAGGAIMIEFTAEFPGKYLLVDHSLTRAIDKGAVAELIVEGDEKPEIFRAVTP